MIRVSPLALFLALAGPAAADVKPHALISDGMVIQQGKPAHLFGTAAPGEKVTAVFTRGNPALKVETTAGADGKFLVEFPPMKADGFQPATITLAGANNTVTVKDVLVGEVWVCSGQSNMEWTLNKNVEPEKAIAEADFPNLRMFTVARKYSLEPLDDCGGKWDVCSPKTAGKFSAVGYWFGRKLLADMKVPIGLIHTSVGGTPAEAWTSAEGLKADPSLAYYMATKDERVKAFSPEKAKADHEAALAKWKAAVEKAKADKKPEPKQPQIAKSPATDNHLPTILYNGMIHPIIRYPVKGATWYQGESNSGKAFEYRALLPAMIRDWRKAWHDADDYSFLVVHLAPFQAIDKEPANSSWAELRDAQHNATVALPKVGEAVITDVGEANDIHPRRKQPVGERLALAAEGIAYDKHIIYQGPTLEKVTVEGPKAVVHLKHAGGGLTVKGDAPTGFAVAGADGKYYWAEAKVEKETVVLTCKDVPEPKTVRFGWSNNPQVNLYNAEGLPAVPFRTDDQPMVTGPKKK